MTANYFLFLTHRYLLHYRFTMSRLHNITQNTIFFSFTLSINAIHGPDYLIKRKRRSDVLRTRLTLLISHNVVIDRDTRF